MKQKRLFGAELTPWEEADLADHLCAQVVFDRPLDQTFDYRVPDELRDALRPGQRVLVPFGRGDRGTVGYCVGVARPTHDRPLKPVLELVDTEPLLSPNMLALTRWIADRYLCPWGQVLESVIPAGVKNQSGTREVLYLRINSDVWTLQSEVQLPAKQAAVMKVLASAEKPMRIEEVCNLATCGTGPITALRRKRFITAFSERTAPVIDATPAGPPAAPLLLNPDQQRVLDGVLSTLRAQEHRTFLLHGVTGSGKTEVYIRAIEEIVSYGRQAIVLVPEISLTPQTIRRFQARFARVAVLHSHLSDVDRHRQWAQIAKGDVQVIVGARSAVFAPTPHLGLIVIDEEHETTFKQDSAPRYHTREVARKRAELERIPLMLGSATPTLESWVRVQRNEDTLLQMPRRVGNLPMPPVSIVDVRQDPNILRGASLGRVLRQEMKRALDAKGQVILFLNVRGYSPVIWCRACGQPVKCSSCDVTLTLHKDVGCAVCHFCGATSAPPTHCPSCKQPGIRFLGTGTQRLEQEVHHTFGGFRALRMDSDSMRKHGSHDVALEAFRRQEVQILLGTQMIAKGLDFPDVTLVGVIDADTVLHQPDLRASERTFQLIAQVAGRTGRGTRGGKVIVQTACPEEPAIQAASRHDYVGFIRRELTVREGMRAPPFEQLIRIILRSPREAEVKAFALELAELLREQVKRLAAATFEATDAPRAGLDMPSSPAKPASLFERDSDSPAPASASSAASRDPATPPLAIIGSRAPSAVSFRDIRVIGPAPAPVTKLQDYYRFHIQLAAPRIDDLLQLWRSVAPHIARTGTVEFAVDVDPVNMR